MRFHLLTLIFSDFKRIVHKYNRIIQLWSRSKVHLARFAVIDWVLQIWCWWQKTQFRYHCEFNITKHHSSEGVDPSSSATDLLSLELDTAMDMLDPMAGPLALPNTREEAVKLNRSNLSAAVSTHDPKNKSTLNMRCPRNILIISQVATHHHSLHSRRVSLVPPGSRRMSLVTQSPGSRRMSLLGSRRPSFCIPGLLGSRRSSLVSGGELSRNSSSFNLLPEVDQGGEGVVEEVPDNVSAISRIADTQAPVMSLYYKQDNNQVSEDNWWKRKGFPSKKHC